MSTQLFIKFGVSSYTQNGFPAKTISNFKRAWRAHFLSHSHETQEICSFLADVQIILVSLFEFFDYIKVAKNAGAFISRCSELLDCSFQVPAKQEGQKKECTFSDSDPHRLQYSTMLISRLTQVHLQEAMGHLPGPQA